jgi:two-component system response regulator YesN
VAIIKEEYPSVSLSFVADRLYISPTHLSRLFAAEKGVTFSHYVQRYRMTVAKQLLADPQYKIYNVARMVGYSDVAHFSKAFKQQEGMSPLKYRNLSGSGDGGTE